MSKNLIQGEQSLLQGEQSLVQGKQILSYVKVWEERPREFPRKFNLNFFQVNKYAAKRHYGGIYYET